VLLANGLGEGSSRDQQSHVCADIVRQADEGIDVRLSTALFLRFALQSMAG
jgi:hypothetical protein